MRTMPRRRRSDGPVDLARRRRARRGGLGRLARPAVWVLGVSLLAVGTWVGAALRVERVRVEGLKDLSPELVGRVAALEGGERMLFTRMSRVAHRVEVLPGVARARAYRSFPSTVVVEVVERVALARLDGRPALGVDRDGVVFGVRPDAPLPVLVGWRGEPKEGRRLDAGTRLLLAGYGEFPPALRARVTRISGGDAALLLLTGDVEVRLGRAVRLRAKGAAAQAVLADAAARGMELEYVDVRAPSTPVVGERNSAVGERTAAASPKTAPKAPRTRAPRPTSGPTPRPSPHPARSATPVR